MSYNLVQADGSLKNIAGGGGALSMTQAEWEALDPKPADGTQVIITDDVTSSATEIIDKSFSEVQITVSAQGTYEEYQIAKLTLPKGKYLLVGSSRINGVSAINSSSIKEGVIGIAFADKRINKDIGTSRTFPAFGRDNQIQVTTIWESDGSSELWLMYQGHYNCKCGVIKIIGYKIG